MEINYTYSIKSEIGYINSISSRSEYFEKNGYKVKAPGGIELKKISQMSQKEIINIVKAEMDPALVKRLSQELVRKIKENKKDISRYLDTLPGNKPDKFFVTWTKYGPGGSYGKPGHMRLRVDASVHPIVNFIDETTHSIIQDSIVDKYSLSHKEKESIVDYLTTRILPEKKYSKFGVPSAELLKKVGLK